MVRQVAAVLAAGEYFRCVPCTECDGVTRYETRACRQTDDTECAPVTTACDFTTCGFACKETRGPTPQSDREVIQASLSLWSFGSSSSQPEDV